jgi:peptidoglycan/LPS O-acetylase OafA/YrhL
MIQTNNRLEALDWLRGLMALSILLYHLGSFGYLGGPHDAATALGKLGIYGVSIFFILSGLSMAIGYDRFICDFRSSVAFFVRRLFRIWPLLWLAIALVAVPAYFNGNPYSPAKIAINATTIFGFTFPRAYINMGAWSIGNEVVYYSLTPFLLMVYKKSIRLGNALTFSSVLLGAIFAFRILSPEHTLADQWDTYINPFNNLFLYASGIAIYYNFRNITIDRRWHGSVVFTVVCLFFYTHHQAIKSILLQDLIEFLCH